MTKRALVITLMVAVAIAAVVGGPAAAHRPGTGSSHEAEFTGAAVVPPGDPDGAGTAQLILFPGREKFCYRINVSNVGDATDAHLHRGSAGENGPVVRKLLPPKDGFSRECVKRYGREGVRQIGNNLSEYYVDVHTDEYPDGAVRAQFGD